jgi:hypothetical protein
MNSEEPTQSEKKATQPKSSEDSPATNSQDHGKSGAPAPNRAGAAPPGDTLGGTEKPVLPKPSKIRVGSFTVRCNPELVVRGKKDQKQWVIRYRLSLVIGGKRLSKTTSDPEKLEREAKDWVKTLNSRRRHFAMRIASIS